MTVWLKFAGWFQCRLPTDPDPSDEGRGVSGYTHALPGEPDLDRIIRLQPAGAVQRSHCPPVGVTVVRVYGTGADPTSSPLIGAAVDLLDEPKFEGRNHAVAEDGFEALVPCHLEVRRDGFRLGRRFDDTMRFPPESDEDRALLRRLQASGVRVSPGAIGEATGIFDLREVWAERSLVLRQESEAARDEVERAVLAARIAGMSEPRNARHFGARMEYAIPLAGSADVEDPDGWLPGEPETSPDAPWPLELWFGGWDADALNGYVTGFLGVPLASARGETVTAVGLAAMMADPRQRRR